jgi:hypothetical protein
MRRFARCLILLMAPCQVAWAEDAFNQSQRGACVYSDASPSKPAAPSRPAAQESSSPAARISRPAEASGGGGSEDDLMQRMRAPRWHSFLPGMFR